MDLFFTENRVYYVADIDSTGKYKIRSSLVYKWIETNKDVIVIDRATLGRDEPNIALLTKYELAVEGKHQEDKFSTYQEGIFNYIEFDWMTDQRLSVPDWHRQILNRIHPEWFNMTEDYTGSPRFADMMRKLNREERKKYAVYPSKEETFRAFEARPDKIRLVVVGQDPYTGGIATGIAFGSKGESTPSLLQIEKAIKSSIKVEGELDYTLRSWVKQGALMLNTALTIRATQTNSHEDYWKSFIRRVLIEINKFPKPLPIILLGTKARDHRYRFTNNDHLVLEAEHPASALYNNREWEHEDVFLDAHKFILKHSGKQFKWLNKPVKKEKESIQIITS